MKKNFVILLLFLTSCDTFYTIALTKNSPDKDIISDCGKVNISLQNWQGHSFDFYQEYQLKDTLTLYRDSISIFFKGEQYPVQFLKEGEGFLKENEVKLIGESLMRISFHIEGKVNKGDTLEVFPKGYMYCKENEVELDNMILVMKEDLRGPFGK